jgi:5-methylcytosine-specific restriction protein A
MHPRLIYHLRRERDAKIVKAKKDEVWNRTKKLCCEACGFDFNTVYGAMGERFCEAHHIKPLSKSYGLVRTKLDDLAIVSLWWDSGAHWRLSCWTLWRAHRQRR